MTTNEELLAEAREIIDPPNTPEQYLIDRLADALEAATRERDAALAAIERVRAEARAYAKQPDVLEPCGAAAQSILAALDGAPEPEEKP